VFIHYAYVIRWASFHPAARLFVSAEQYRGNGRGAVSEAVARPRSTRPEREVGSQPRLECWLSPAGVVQY